MENIMFEASVGRGCDTVQTFLYVGDIASALTQMITSVSSDPHKRGISGQKT